MLSLLLLWLGALIRLFRSRGSLVLENLTLRQQLAVLKRRHPRPSLGLFDKLFWVIARRVWSAWKESLHRYARNSRPLAPDWFSYVLEADLQSPEGGWKKTDAEGGSRADLSDGC